MQSTRCSMSIQTCYMCNREATSREHAPPRNLFPTSKEGGRDFRKSLITVPSCDEHNASKSKDDEFLMVTLAGIVGNNSIGYQHKLTKVDRAIRRTAGRLIDAVVIKNKSKHRLVLEDNKFIDVIWGTPDAKRMRFCFDHMARALHYHHFNKQFDGEVRIMLGYLFHSDKNSRTWVDFIRDRASLDLTDKKRLGENPEVFYFQVSDFDEHGIFMMRLCFYGGVVVYAAFIPSTSTLPTHIGTELIRAGIKTVITLGDKGYEFNGD